MQEARDRGRLRRQRRIVESDRRHLNEGVQEVIARVVPLDNVLDPAALRWRDPFRSRQSIGNRRRPRAIDVTSCLDEQLAVRSQPRVGRKCYGPSRGDDNACHSALHSRCRRLSDWCQPATAGQTRFRNGERREREGGLRREGGRRGRQCQRSQQTEPTLIPARHVEGHRCGAGFLRRMSMILRLTWLFTPGGSRVSAAAPRADLVPLELGPCRRDWTTGPLSRRWQTRTAKPARSLCGSARSCCLCSPRTSVPRRRRRSAARPWHTTQ